MCVLPSLPWSHPTFLIRFYLKDVRRSTVQSSIASTGVVEEHVGLTVADEAGSARRDS